MSDVLVMVAVALGVSFMLVASLGVLWLPDFYARLHAPTKAATLGLACLFVALAIHLHDRTSVTKAVLAVLLVCATAPVGAHALSRAAYRRGQRAPGATVDELAQKHEPRGDDR
jgi:multicomponent Na+:H+ antiporter subunit G